MARIRAKVTLPWTTNLPQDVTINTFHFLTASSPATSTEKSDISFALSQFYNNASGVAGTDIAGYLSNLVSRVALACRIDLYDLDDPEPRQPIYEDTFTLGAADQANSMPTEVALCLSFQAAPISGVPQARRRGRVYIGPFNNAAVTTAGSPPDVFVDSLTAAGNFMLDTFQGASPVRWCVYSQTADALAEVTDGWCDNEWDTMRSRGRRATSRDTFN